MRDALEHIADLDAECAELRTELNNIKTTLSIAKYECEAAWAKNDELRAELASRA
jgi:hypothetical protein